MGRGGSRHVVCEVVFRLQRSLPQFLVGLGIILYHFVSCFLKIQALFSTGKYPGCQRCQGDEAKPGSRDEATLFFDIF